MRARNSSAGHWRFSTCLCRSARYIPQIVLLVLLSSAAEAQVTWQPAPAPQVTADSESWYRAGEAIEWNGTLYYPAGAPEAFNRYQMVRTGTYRGVPLYSDTTLEPNSIVFVPIAGGRMQPYERPRTGTLAGTAGSRTSSFPTSSSTESSSALGVTSEGFVVQAPAPPSFARAYDYESSSGPQPMSPAVPVVAGRIGSSDAAQTPQPTGTSGRSVTITNQAGTAAQPRGINGAWFDYKGRRWVSAGSAVDLTADFTRIGEYKGSPVFQRRGDSVTIYIPTSTSLVTPFKPRS